VTDALNKKYLARWPGPTRPCSVEDTLPTRCAWSRADAMAQFRVLYTDRGDYAHDFSIEAPMYATIGAQIIDCPLDHNSIDLGRPMRATLARLTRPSAFRMPVGRRAVEAAPRLKVAVRSGVGLREL